MTEKGYRMATLTGNKLADLLKERGMNQKELAEAACLTPASVSRYVNGEPVKQPVMAKWMTRVPRKAEEK